MKWARCSDKMPEKGALCLCKKNCRRDGNAHFDIALCRGDSWIRCGFYEWNQCGYHSSKYRSKKFYDCWAYIEDIDNAILRGLPED